MRPPTRSCASNNCTRTPARCNRYAHVKPAMPPPMTTTEARGSGLATRGPQPTAASAAAESAESRNIARRVRSGNANECASRARSTDQSSRAATLAKVITRRSSRKSVVLAIVTRAPNPPHASLPKPTEPTTADAPPRSLPHLRRTRRPLPPARFPTHDFVLALLTGRLYRALENVLR